MCATKQITFKSPRRPPPNQFLFIIFKRGNRYTTFKYSIDISFEAEEGFNRNGNNYTYTSVVTTFLSLFFLSKEAVTVQRFPGPRVSETFRSLDFWFYVNVREIIRCGSRMINPQFLAMNVQQCTAPVKMFDLLHC